jgi:hypothetical protein
MNTIFAFIISLVFLSGSADPGASLDRDLDWLNVALAQPEPQVWLKEIGMRGCKVQTRYPDRDTKSTRFKFQHIDAIGKLGRTLIEIQIVKHTKRWWMFWKWRLRPDPDALTLYYWETFKFKTEEDRDQAILVFENIISTCSDLYPG